MKAPIEYDASLLCVFVYVLVIPSCQKTSHLRVERLEKPPTRRRVVKARQQGGRPRSSGLASQVSETHPADLRGGLQLSDISENPNNDRIDGDPPTHPPNPNKCLMLDVMYIGRYTQPLLFMEYGCFEKKDSFGLAFPNKVACISKLTRSLSV